MTSLWSLCRPCAGSNLRSSTAAPPVALMCLRPHPLSDTLHPAPWGEAPDISLSDEQGHQEVTFVQLHSTAKQTSLTFQLSQMGSWAELRSPITFQKGPFPALLHRELLYVFPCCPGPIDSGPHIDTRRQPPRRWMPGPGPLHQPYSASSSLPPSNLSTSFSHFLQV